MKTVNIDWENLQIFWPTWGRKDAIYDKIKSNKNPEFHPLLRRYIFGKTTGGGGGGGGFFKS